MPPGDYQAVSDRITKLQNSQGWLTPQAMSAYATSNLSDGDMMDQAEQFRQTVVSSQQQNGSPSSYQTFFSDPVLSKHPTVALALRDFLTGAVGVDQIAGQSTRQMQRMLAANMPDATKHMDINGVWDDGWQGVKTQFAQHMTNSALQGNKPGSTTVSHALDFLGAFNPTPAADAMLGFVKGLPGDVRQVLADMAGGAAGVLPEITGRVEAGLHGEFGEQGYNQFVRGQTARAESGAQSAVVNALGGNTNPTEQAAQTGMTPEGNLAPGGLGTFAGKAVGDLGTVWLGGDMAAGLTKILSSGAALGYGVGGAAAKEGLDTAAEATTQGGVVSRTMEGADKTAATYRGPQVLAQKIGQPITGLLARAAESVPALAHTGPWIDTLADADGAYYRARRFLALPYIYRPVQVAGEGLQDLSMQGAKTRAVAALSPNTPLGQSVQGEHLFDTFNEALKNLSPATPLGHVTDLNNLAFLLHAPNAGAVGSTSTKIGGQVSGAVKAVNSMVDTPIRDLIGMHGIRQASTLPGWEPLFLSVLKDTGMSRKDAVAVAGSEPDYYKWMTSTVNQHAMYAQAEHNVAMKTLEDAGQAGVGISMDPNLITEADRAVHEKLLGQDADTITAVRDAASTIRDDTSGALLDEARKNLLAQRQGQEFVNRFRNALSLQRQQDAMNGVSWEKGAAPRLGSWLDDSKTVNRDVLPFIKDSTVAKAKPDAEADAAQAEYQANVTGRRAVAVTKKPPIFLSGPSRPQDLGIANEGALTVQEAQRTGAKLRQEWADNTAMQSAHDQKIAELHSGATEQTDAFGQPVASAMTEDQINKAFPLPSPNWADDWHDKVGDLIMRMGSIDQRNMAAKGPELLDEAMKYAKALLPGEVTVDDGAHVPGQVLDAIDQLAANGRKLVVARDVGHMHVGESMLDDLGHTYTVRRQIMNHLGLNPNITNDADLPTNVRINLRNRISDMVAKGDTPDGMVLPPYTRPDTIIALMHEDGFLPDYLNMQGKLHAALARNPPAHIDLIKNPDLRAVAQKLQADHPDVPENQIIVNAMHIAAKESTQFFQMRDLPYKSLHDSYGSPREFEERSPMAQARAVREDNAAVVRPPAPAGAETPGVLPSPSTQLNRPMLDDRSVRNLQLATRKAYADLPASMVGWQKPENMFRASMGWAGTGGVKGRMLGGAVLGGAAGVAVDPGAVFQGDFTHVGEGAAAGALAGGVFKKMGWAMANLPNDLVRMRNAFRFDLSPEFAMRRYVKTNVKMAAEGVPPIGIESNFLHSGPVNWLQKHGVLDEARDIFQRVAPEYDTRLRGLDENADDMQRYLASNDVFHMTNTRDTEAYAAYHWSQQGLSDQEIHDKIVKTFGYGAKDVNGVSQAGRSALEKSINTVFFPFSFDKTLYRNMGGYLLDHAGQRIFLTQALAAYDQFNKQHPDMPGAADWMDKHLPILSEVQRLNAFAHGVGLGQFGGINAPMLQLFLPQQWSPSTQNQSNLEKFIPVVKDFKRIFTGANGQAGVFSQQADIIHSEITGQGAAETPFAQVQQAFDLRRKLDTQWGQVMAFNQGKKAGAQVRFSIDPSYGVFAGQPITRATIDRMVHQQYAAYDSGAGAANAIQNATKWQEFLDQRGQGETTYGAELAAFGANVTTLGQKIQDSRFVAPSSSRYWSPQALETLSASLRSSAMKYAESDPQFLALYKKSFEHVLGPLEALQ